MASISTLEGNPIVHNGALSRGEVDSRFRELLTLINERDRRYTERSAQQDKAVVDALAAAEKAVNAALVAADKAVTKAEGTAEKWRDSANEWRDAMNDRETAFLKKEEGSLMINAVSQQAVQGDGALDRRLVLMEGIVARGLPREEFDARHTDVVNRIASVDQNLTARIGVLEVSTGENAGRQRGISSTWSFMLGLGGFMTGLMTTVIIAIASGAHL